MSETRIQRHNVSDIRQKSMHFRWTAIVTHWNHDDGFRRLSTGDKALCPRSSLFTAGRFYFQLSKVVRTKLGNSKNGRKWCGHVPSVNDAHALSCSTGQADCNVFHSEDFRHSLTGRTGGWPAGGWLTAMLFLSLSLSLSLSLPLFCFILSLSHSHSFSLPLSHALFNLSLSPSSSSLSFTPTLSL